MSYDSRPDTHEHIAQVRGLVLGVVQQLIERAHQHDRSKLEEPELAVFDEVTPRLEKATYGSEEYKGFLSEMSEALEPHYRRNDHHPQHFRLGERDPPWWHGIDREGIEAMGLVAMTEMLCDWIAASRRHDDDKDVHDSIEMNAKRFGYGDELTLLLHNSVDEILYSETAL